MDGATNTVTGSVGAPIGHIAYNSSNQNVYGTDLTENEVYRIDANTLTFAGLPIPVGTLPTGIVAEPSTNRVYVASWGDQTVSVISSVSNTVIDTIPLSTVDNQPWSMVVNPSASRLYVLNADLLGSGVEPPTISIIDTLSNTEIGTIALPHMNAGYGQGAFTLARPQFGGNRLAVSSDDSIILVDLSDNSVEVVPVAAGPFSGIDFWGSEIWTSNDSDLYVLASNAVGGAVETIVDSDNESRIPDAVAIGGGVLAVTVLAAALRLRRAQKREV